MNVRLPHNWQEILDLEEESTARGQTFRARQARERFGLSLTRYFQELGRIIDTEAALEYRPQLVARARRLRDQRRQARTVRSIAPVATTRDPRQGVLA